MLSTERVPRHFPPTLGEITGPTLNDEVKQQVEGRSLLPLLKASQAGRPDRLLEHHVGRWSKGQSEDFKYTSCAIQDSRFTLVNNKELYDLSADSGEQTNVIREHPGVAATLRTAYDQSWADVQPLLANDNVLTAPKVNVLKELYWKQFGGGSDARRLKRMAPGGASGEEEQPPKPRRHNKK